MSQGSPAKSDEADVRGEKRRALTEALAASVLVTAAVKLVSMVTPETYVAVAVGFCFLGATWFLVWRSDDARVRRFGLALGGLIMPGKLAPKELGRAALSSLGWAFAFAAVVFVPFFFGWRRFWGPTLHFSLALSPLDELGTVFGQLIVIALPEEAFYRGYLQTRLDDAMPPRLRIFGAKVGPGILVASTVFALGHLATIPQPARLAVFFPALLFGWLRARTGGIGASVVFHASCNVFSELLGRGYGVY